MKRYLYVIGGCLIIAITYNLLFLPYDLVPNGIFGIGALLNYHFNYDPALFLAIINLLLLILAYICLKEKAIKYTIPSVLIPAFVYLTSPITDYLYIGNVEILLIAILGSFITGFGYSMIYKQGFSTGGIDIFQDIINSVSTYRKRTISFIIEGIIVVFAAYLLNIESGIYSLIIIAIIRYLATKSKTGISSSKTFFIITTKEEEIKSYLIKELKYDLTEFNVKGGFSNNKSKILMTAIDTKEYYRVKEGILLIDPGAFISIMDSYEVINKNVSLLKHEEDGE